MDAREQKEDVYKRVIETLGQLPRTFNRRISSVLTLVTDAHSGDAFKACKTARHVVGGINAAIVKQRMKANTGTEKGAGVFPGSYPVSLSTYNLELLLENRHEYVVGHKLDGVRQLLFITNSKLYLFDRKMTATRILLSPADEEKEDASWLIEWNGTLLDGELVRKRDDHVKQQHQAKRQRLDADTSELRTEQEASFVVLDALALKDKNVMKLPYPKRMDAAKPFMALLEERADRGFHLYVSTDEKDDTPKDRLVFALHRTFPLDVTPSLLAPTQHRGTEPRQVYAEYPTDGLVFQPVSAPYCVGYSKEILKWKPPRETTIDFYVTKGEDAHTSEGQQTWQLHVMGTNNRLSYWDTMQLDTPEEHKGEITEGCIVECYWDTNEERWRLHRVRVDKDRPNAEWVANIIWKNLESGLLEADDLLKSLTDEHPEVDSISWQTWRKGGGKNGNRKRKRKGK